MGGLEYGQVLHEYERTRRLEEDALEYAVASNLDDDGLSQVSRVPRVPLLSFSPE